MRYILGLKEEPQFYASYGSLIHKIIEMFYNGKIKREEMKAFFLTNFSSVMNGSIPSERTVASYINKGIDYLESFQQFPYKMVAVEKQINFDIDGIPFVAFVDFIGEDTDGNLVVIDNKSRELKPRSGRKKPTKNDADLDEMLRQLYIYAIAVKKEYGKFPSKLCFNCFKNKVFIEEPFDLQKCDETKQWIKNSIEEIKSSESGDFYPNVDFFSCYYICGLSDECCFWQNR